MAQRGRPKKKDLVSEEFKNLVAAMKTEDLKERVVTLSKHEKEVVRAMREDRKLEMAKDEAKELSGPYKDSLKVLKAQRSYVLEQLEDHGQ